MKDKNFEDKKVEILTVLIVAIMLTACNQDSEPSLGVDPMTTSTKDQQTDFSSIIQSDAELLESVNNTPTNEIEMFDVLPYIDVTPAEYFKYKYNDSLDGIIITAYTGDSLEVRIPDKIEDTNIIKVNLSNEFTELIMPNTVQSYNINYDKLKYVNIPRDAEVNVHGDFLESVYIVDGVKVLDSIWSPNLKSITIPNSVTEIGDFAFSRCTSLTNITIPESVLEIGEAAFWNCTGLLNIDVDSKNKKFCSVNGILFNKDESQLICYPAGKTDTEYVIPDTVNAIDRNAFENCISLKNITIPTICYQIGYSAFAGCTGLTGSITIPATVIEGDAFKNCANLTSITFTKVYKINSGAFSGCTGLTNIVFDDVGWIMMPENTFSNSTELKSITYMNVTFNSLESFLANRGDLYRGEYNG